MPLAGAAREIKLGAMHPTRDFNHVHDTVRGFVAVAECDAAVGQVINIGSNYEVSVGDTARLIASRVQSRAHEGAYDAVTDPRRFADALTSDLQSVNGDRHLSVSYASPSDAGPRRPAGAPLQLRAQVLEAWDAIRIDADPSASVKSLKQLALRELYPHQFESSDRYR